MTTEISTPPSSDGDRVRPKEVHFASPVAGGTYHPTRSKGTPQPYRRRLTIDREGQYTYKKTPSSILMSSLQLGLQHSIGSIEPKPRRDILMTDFEDVETVDFPAAGSGSAPAHKFKDFTFKTYSPVAFRFFREAFGIVAEDFLIAMCDRPLREISNPGASGSLFYLSVDDAFIIKTVQKKEAHFLQKLLPGYYLNLTQNKRTLLPKFFGLYRYKSGSINIRIVVMNNLLPSSIRLHEKYDLKGSTYKRLASPSEITKKSPIFKDLDYAAKHEEGISLTSDGYEALLRSVQRDCKVLESFGIMDYSLLLGVHNIDHAHRERAESLQSSSGEAGDITTAEADVPSRLGLGKNYSIISTENIPAAMETAEETPTAQYPDGFIQGRIRGDRVLLYLGIIDILQSYRFKKQLEHSFKSLIADGNTVSVHNPSYYARRFQDFITTQVFKKEKTKYRTRKNSTNVQLRGRKPNSVRLVASPRSPQEPGKSGPSPTHALPTYTQATCDPVVSPSPLDRQRSLSDPTQLQEVSTLSLYSPKLETIESIPGKGSSIQQVQNGEEVSHGQKVESHDVEVIVEHPNESSDFAREVRCGTSTPIDESPNAREEQSRTFDPDATGGGLVTVDTAEIELSAVDNKTGIEVEC